MFKPKNPAHVIIVIVAGLLSVGFFATAIYMLCNNAL